MNSLVLNYLDVDGALDIKTGENSVTINNNLTIDASATSNIADGSSLLVNGTASGNLTYTRTLDTTNWYGITSPVNGQDIDTFISAEGLAQSIEDSDVGLSQSYGTFSDTWTYYNTSSSSSGNFVGGKGYIIKLVSDGDIALQVLLEIQIFQEHSQQVVMVFILQETICFLHRYSFYANNKYRNFR